MNLKQFSIYCFDLSKDSISSSKNITYAVVLSPNEMNDCLRTVIVAPLCNDCAITPTTFLIDDITRIKLDQITIIEKNAATQFITKLDYRKIIQIRDVISDIFIKE